MSSTKLESYIATLPTASACEQKILDALYMSLPKSREELAAATGLRLSTVCGRVTPMLAQNRLVVAGRIWNAQSHRNVETISLP